MTKQDCIHYNWGGGSDDKPAYPRAFGARCEFYKRFFVHGSHVKDITCENCKHYKRRFVMRRNFRKRFYKRTDGKWAWRIVAGNGRIIATDGGQGYERRGMAEKSFESFVAAIKEGRVK